MEYYFNNFQLFLVIWVRIISAILMAPLFSSNNVPIRLKLLFGFLIALMVYPWASKLLLPPPDDLLIYATILVKEVLVGLVLGLLLAMIFASAQLGTQFFAVQIGLGMSEVFDPITQEQRPLLGNLFYSMVVLIFISIGGFHIMVQAWVDSFRVLPVIYWEGNQENFIEMGIRYFNLMFVIALKLAFPIIATSFIVVMALGLLGKVAPQANILILGLPLQWGVGIVMILLFIPAVVDLFISFINNGISDALHYLKRFNGS